MGPVVPEAPATESDLDKKLRVTRQVAPTTRSHKPQPHLHSLQHRPGLCLYTSTAAHHLITSAAGRLTKQAVPSAAPAFASGRCGNHSPPDLNKGRSPQTVVPGLKLSAHAGCKACEVERVAGSLCKCWSVQSNSCPASSPAKRLYLLAVTPTHSPNKQTLDSTQLQEWRRVTPVDGRSCN